MTRSGVVLLLLTSAAAVQYHWQAAVSLPGPAVQTISTVSRSLCALRCEALPPKKCSGFTYGEDTDTCRLFSGDCRGPAADSPQQTTGRYMGRNQCAGKNTTTHLCFHSLHGIPTCHHLPISTYQTSLTFLPYTCRHCVQSVRLSGRLQSLRRPLSGPAGRETQLHTGGGHMCPARRPPGRAPLRGREPVRRDSRRFQPRLAGL